MTRVEAATFFVPLTFAMALLVLQRADIDSEVQLAALEPPAVATSDERTETTIVGTVSVIDGDTIEILGTRIRLNGIDAPESGQNCNISGERYRCGQKAALFLQDVIGRSQAICMPLGSDRYERIIASCTTDNRDLGSVMVANGWALAYRKYDTVYVPQENDARDARIGIWAGEFVEPWLWRAGQR